MHKGAPIHQTSTRREQSATRKGDLGHPPISHHSSAATSSYSSTLHAEPKSRPIVAGPSSQHLHWHELGALSPASRATHDFLSAVNRSLALSAEPITS